MDSELKSHLEAIEGRIVAVDRRFDAMEERFNERIDALSDRFANLVAGEIGVIHREMRENFDRIDARLNRQGEMLTNGTKALGGLVDYVERADSNYARLLREVEELRARVNTLEKKVA